MSYIQQISKSLLRLTIQQPISRSTANKLKIGPTSPGSLSLTSTTRYLSTFQNLSRAAPLHFTLSGTSTRALCAPVTSSPVVDIHRGYTFFSFRDSLSGYLKRIIDKGPHHKRKVKKIGPTEGRPFLKGVVLKTIIKKPKKPNSANRKCVRVKLSTGRETTAYVPGIGHNLQEHHTVLVRGGKVQDVPGVKLKCVRGKYDLAHVKKVIN